MKGNLNMNKNKIINHSDPVEDNDVVNLKYVKEVEKTISNIKKRHCQIRRIFKTLIKFLFRSQKRFLKIKNKLKT